MREPEGAAECVAELVSPGLTTATESCSVKSTGSVIPPCVHLADVRQLVFDALDDDQVAALESIARAVGTRVDDPTSSGRSE